MSVPVAGNAFLITGGASLIGSHLSTELLKAGARKVILFDNLSLGSEALLNSLETHKAVEIIRGDIRNLDELHRAAEGVDGIFALAAYLTLPLSKNPVAAVQVNALGAVNVLEAARQCGGAKVVFASSIAVYGANVHALVDENTASDFGGVSPAFASYASSKLLGESLGRLYSQLLGIPFCAVRFSTVYGENQHSRGVNALYILDALRQVRGGEAPVIRGDGSEAHDYIHVQDAALGCLRAMEQGATGEAYNLSTHISTSVSELVRMVIEEYDGSVEPVYVDDTRSARSTSHSQLLVSNEKARRQLQWEPKVSLREGIGRLRTWLEATDQEIGSSPEQSGS